jgi:hypothetical protein
MREMLLFVNVYNLTLLKPSKFFRAALYTKNMVPCQFVERFEQIEVLLSLFHNKVTS